jgi:dolichol-phosphate mannosyltransferase
MKPQISILIPLLNESENIPFLIDKLRNFCKEHREKRFEVIFIDDGSEDNSVQLLQQQSHDLYNYKILKLSQNFGSHAALRAGILYAEGEYITCLYADLQDPIELVAELYEKIQQEKSEIVWACRNQKQGFFSVWYAKMMKNFVTQKYPEHGFDVVMFSRKVQNLLNKNIESNSSVFLQILTFGFSQSYITYQKQTRRAGKSQWTFSKKMKLWIDSFVAFSFFPIRLVSIVGILLFLGGIFFASYLVVRKLIWDDLKEGWTALASILMIGFGITNISLGIIAEYLWRTLDASRKRPVFIVDEVIEKVNK